MTKKNEIILSSETLSPEHPAPSPSDQHPAAPTYVSAIFGIRIQDQEKQKKTAIKTNRCGEVDMHLFDGVRAHHHGPAQRLVEPVVHAVDQVGQVVHKVPGEPRSSLML